ncbi:hypothetical protein OSB04_026459 [Centaurea solstitialis]|uniref:Uncharacterized protein n=1 Tax=Centaurea solstitialis TaxID=347529 RepID=A0AA38SCR0_9ASTR|nr:hypothetical protein OSB04_026459 [Centaurea solstitialis]
MDIGDGAGKPTSSSLSRPPTAYPTLLKPGMPPASNPSTHDSRYIYRLHRGFRVEFSVAALNLSSNSHGQGSILNFLFCPYCIRFIRFSSAFGPLESSFKKAAKDFEHRWPGGKNGGKTGEIAMGNEGKVELFGVKKRNGQGVVGDDRKKGHSWVFSCKTMSGIGDRKVVVSKKELDVRDCSKEDGTCINCMQFAVTWSLLVSSFVQAVPGPFRNGKKKIQKRTNGDKICKHIHVSEYKSKNSRDRNDFMSKRAFPQDASGDTKKTELKSGLILLPCEETLEIKDGNNMSLEHFLGFVFDQLALNLQKFELGVQESGTRNATYLQFLHIQASGFLGNLKFARVGGVPSGIVDLSSSAKGEGDDNVSSNVTEENVSSFSQRMANGLLSIPLSNVERLRSTLSTVSLTELIELVPQLGRSPKDHPDKKKLFRSRISSDTQRQKEGDFLRSWIEMAMGKSLWKISRSLLERGSFLEICSRNDATH